MAENEIYDVIIIGGGPAAVSAGVYTARKELKTLLITVDFNSQSVVSEDIQNWIGDQHISGVDLAKKWEDHIRSYQEIVTVKTGEKVVKVDSLPLTGQPRPCEFKITTDKNTTYLGKSIIVASGARRRRTGVPGEDKYDGKGVAFCSTCDAPIFRNKSVAVVGGGNAGLEAVHDLFQYAKEVYVIENSDKLAGDPIRVDEVKQNPKLKEVLMNTQLVEITGEVMMNGLKVKNKTTGEERTLDVQGVFIEIGSVPNSEIVKDFVQLDEHNQIIVNFAHARTSYPGIFAAGDVTNDPYKQNIIAAGDGVRAALACYAYLQGKDKITPSETPKTLDKEEQGEVIPS